jgi:hypothetical protein
MRINEDENFQPTGEENSGELNNEKLQNQNSSDLTDDPYFSEEDDEEDEEDYSESCPIVGFMEDLVMISQESKPFGITWNLEDMKDFLEKRGYKILKRYDKETDISYELALKPDDEIPEHSDPDKYKFIPQSVFDRECRELSKKLMLKLSNWIDKDDEKNG